MTPHFGLYHTALGPQRRLTSRTLPIPLLAVMLIGVTLASAVGAAHKVVEAQDAVVEESPKADEAKPAESTKPAEDKEHDGRVDLLKSDNLMEQWMYYSAEEGAKPEETWEIVHEKISKDSEETEKILRCSGKPFGYLRTRDVYENCEISLEWRFPKDANGNSGVLVFLDGKDEIWPKSIQVQFHVPMVGGVFPMKDAKCDQPLPGKMLSKAPNEWNKCVVTCRDGTISLKINGEDFGVVKGCMPAKGFIALQSEGAEVHFRRIYKTPLK